MAFDDEAGAYTEAEAVENLPNPIVRGSSVILPDELLKRIKDFGYR